MRYDRLLAGKRALITGGASGLGRACALLFAKHGAAVAVADKDGASGEKTLQDLRAIGPGCRFYLSDLRDEGDIDALCDAVLRDFGVPDIWLNSAGIIRLGLVDQLADDDLQEMMTLHVVAPARIMRQLAPAMIGRRGGAIIQVCGEYSVTGYNAASGYAATMGARHAMTTAFAIDYARHGIRANCLLVGAGVGAMAGIKAAGLTGEQEKELWGTVNPLWRRAEDDEAAGVALFLASDMSGYVTGEGIFVNGGQHIVGHKQIYRRAGGWGG